MGYRYDTQHLRPDQRAIISQKDRNDELLRKAKNNQQNEVFTEIECNISIFMRLGNDKQTELNGIETLEVYEKYCKDNKGEVWFSTNALIYGMSKNKVNFFLKELNKNKVIYIYFAVGKAGGGKNEIEYRAKTIDIVSQAEVIKCPKDKLVPDIWKDRENRIWIKIENLEKCDYMSTSDFVVESSGNILAKSIEKSEYHFGYIKKK